MKRIRLLEETTISGVVHAVNSVVIVDEDYAWELIEQNKATDKIGIVNYRQKT